MLLKNDAIHTKRDKESLRAKQKEVEKMGERHIKEKQRINQVSNVGDAKKIANGEKESTQVMRNHYH